MTTAKFVCFTAWASVIAILLAKVFDAKLSPSAPWALLFLLAVSFFSLAISYERPAQRMTITKLPPDDNEDWSKLA